MKFKFCVFLYVFYLFTIVGAKAAQVSESLTANVASNFFLGKSLNKGTIIQTLNCKSGDQTVAFVHNFSKGGWVMVSADDVIEPIIGYNYTGNYSIDTTDDIQMSIFASLKELIDNKKIQFTQKSAKWDALSNLSHKILKTSSINPYANLLVNDKGEEIKWGQGDYYNDFCPIKEGKHCKVGCVPTAASMIMYKWQWPSHYPETDTAGGSAIEWGKMESELTQKNDAVAMLMASVAKHSLAEFGVDSTPSNIYNLKQTLTDYGYFFTHSTFRSKFFNEDIFTKEEMAKIMRSEIKLGRPVLFSGTHSKASGGHCFVICGIDADNEDYFYCNLGWGGKHNGFYRFSENKDDMLIYFLNPNDVIHHIMPLRQQSANKPLVKNVVCKTGVGAYVEANVENANSYLLLTIKKFPEIDSITMNGTLYTTETMRPKIITRDFGSVDGNSLRIDCGSELIDDGTLYCLVVYNENGEYSYEQRFFDGSECIIEEEDIWSETEASICKEELAIDWGLYTRVSNTDIASVEILKQATPFSIYASTTSDDLYVVSDNVGYGVKLMDMSGREIKDYGTFNGNGILNIDNIPTGVYCVLINWQGKDYRIKVVKK